MESPLICRDNNNNECGVEEASCSLVKEEDDSDPVCEYNSGCLTSVQEKEDHKVTMEILEDDKASCSLVKQEDDGQTTAAIITSTLHLLDHRLKDIFLPNIDNAKFVLTVIMKNTR